MSGEFKDKLSSLIDTMKKDYITSTENFDNIIEDYFDKFGDNFLLDYLNSEGCHFGTHISIIWEDLLSEVINQIGKENCLYHKKDKRLFKSRLNNYLKNIFINCGFKFDIDSNSKTLYTYFKLNT